METEINRKIRYACENGNSAVCNVLLLAMDNSIILVPEKNYIWNKNYIWLATFSPGEGYVGTTRIKENEIWLVYLVKECMQKIEKRDRVKMS